MASDQLEVDLRVIGSLRAHERLSTRGGELRVERTWALIGCVRFLHSEGRDATVSRLNDVVARATARPNPEPRIRVALGLAREGVAQLRQTTYAACSRTDSALDVLISRIDDSLKSPATDDSAW